MVVPVGTKCMDGATHNVVWSVRQHPAQCAIVSLPLLARRSSLHLGPSFLLLRLLYTTACYPVGLAPDLQGGSWLVSVCLGWSGVATCFCWQTYPSLFSAVMLASCLLALARIQYIAGCGARVRLVCTRAFKAAPEASCGDCRQQCV